MGLAEGNFKKDLEAHYIGEGIQENSTDYNLYDNVDDFEIKAPEVCNGYSKHDMLSNGYGTVYKGVYPDTSNLAFSGAAWQCTRCREVVITEYDPLEARYVGYYAFWNPGYKITNNRTYLWTNTIHFTSGSTLLYFKMGSLLKL